MKNWRAILPPFGLLWLRFWMGLGIAHHGFQKLFGGRMDMFSDAVAKMGLPAPEFLAWMAALSEFLGGLLILIGYGTRWAALFIAITMSVAVFIHHSGDPFKMKELAISYLVASIALFMMGSGEYSINKFLADRAKKPKN